MNKYTQHRGAFTLIETVISLSIMSIILLGLSSAMMLGSKAVPSATEAGVNDQQIINAINQFADELRQSTKIAYATNASGVTYTLTMKASSTPGAPTTIKYAYSNSSQDVSRKVDSYSTRAFITGITSLEFGALMDGSRIRAVTFKFEMDSTRQKHFDYHIVLPNKPEAI